jgi:hypothetical protein
LTSITLSRAVVELFTFATWGTNFTSGVATVQHKWDTVGSIGRLAFADVVFASEVEARTATARVVNWRVNSVLTNAAALLGALKSIGELTAR